AARRALDTAPRDFDVRGALVLAGTLSAYALAMTTRHFALLIVAAAGACLFIAIERRTSGALIHPSMLGDRRLSAGLAMSLLVATVMMATLVVGPFYLGGALALQPARMGLVMAIGPLAAAATGLPAGRIVDRFGSERVTLAALAGTTVGLVGLALAPNMFGYIASLVALTISYALFQTANNAAVMARAHADRRGVVSAMLGLSRNLGLISGAAAMGALFAFASGAEDVAAASAAAITVGMQVTFAGAALLSLMALALAAGPGAKKALA
ncbi:MAG: MFS transporter, partial [Sphingomonadaceae bacterium]|nr:MFS transporter [Sphingomonadaceae bacterium]